MRREPFKFDGERQRDNSSGVMRASQTLSSAHLFVSNLDLSEHTLLEKVQTDSDHLVSHKLSIKGILEIDYG